MTQLYRIFWRSLLTGSENHGEQMFTSVEIQKIIKELNTRHNNVIFHWFDPNLE